MTNMKKHLLTALIIFVVVTWGVYAVGFDETPWESNFFIGISMGIGLLTQTLVQFILSPWVSGPKLVGNASAFDLYFNVLPFIAGTFYALVYLGIIAIGKYTKRQINVQHRVLDKVRQ